MLFSGTVINENYSLMLMAHPSMNLMEAVLLDLVQRGKYIEDAALELLRKKHLIEGRRPHVYVAKMVAQKTGKKIEYSKHKGLVSKSCEAMLLESCFKSVRICLLLFLSLVRRCC